MTPRGHRPDAGRCEERERNGALAGIGCCLLVAVSVAVAAASMRAPAEERGGADPTLVMRPPSPPAGTREPTPPERGGTSAAGTGSGAGAAGERTGAAGAEVDEAAAGAPDAPAGAAAQGDRAGASAEGERRLRLGFTIRPPSPTDRPAGRAQGQPDGRDGEGAAGRGAGLMGIETDAKSVVYVLDHSASMRREGFEETLDEEMRRSIRRLPADARFAIVLFGRSPSQGATWASAPDGRQRCRSAIPMPPGQLVDATAANRAKAVAWLATQEPDPAGDSTPWEAMEIALAMNPDAVFLLTDGEFYDPNDVNDLEQVIRDAGARARIHSVAFGSGIDIASLERIAARSGGTYRRIELQPPAP
jgi:hypothetical protein